MNNGMISRNWDPFLYKSKHLVYMFHNGYINMGDSTLFISWRKVKQGLKNGTMFVIPHALTHTHMLW